MAQEERFGTIFMGPNSNRESTMDKVHENLQRELWNRRTEAEYMERVRAKATLRVQTMLDQARTNAEVIRKTAEQWGLKIKAEAEATLAEAAAIKQEAEDVLQASIVQRDAGYEEGYKVGAEQAFLELDEHRFALGEATASVLMTIAEQQDNLYGHWREELVELLQQAVQTSVGWVLREERRAILDSLLETSLKEIEDQRRIVVRVNAEDYQAVASILSDARERFPDLKQWKVIDDPKITAGGLVVESASGMIDDRVEVRQDVVAQVLQHLSLPLSEAEAAAKLQVMASLESSGIVALAEESKKIADAAAAEAADIAAAEAADIAAAEAKATSPILDLPAEVMPTLPSEKMMNLTPEELSVLLQNYPDSGEEDTFPVPYGVEAVALDLDNLDPDADLTVLNIQVPDAEGSVGVAGAEGSVGVAGAEGSVGAAGAEFGHDLGDELNG